MFMYHLQNEELMLGNPVSPTLRQKTPVFAQLHLNIEYAVCLGCSYVPISAYEKAVTKAIRSVN